MLCVLFLCFESSYALVLFLVQLSANGFEINDIVDSGLHILEGPGSSAGELRGLQKKGGLTRKSWQREGEAPGWAYKS